MGGLWGGGLTSANLPAEQRGLSPRLPGRVCLPNCCRHCRERWCVCVCFFFFLTFLHFSLSLWFLILLLVSIFHFSRGGVGGRKSSLFKHFSSAEAGLCCQKVGTSWACWEHSWGHAAADSPTCRAAPLWGRQAGDPEPQRRPRRAGPGSLDYPAAAPALHLAAPHLPLLLARHSPYPFHSAPAPQAVPNQ